MLAAFIALQSVGRRGAIERKSNERKSKSNEAFIERMNVRTSSVALGFRSRAHLVVKKRLENNSLPTAALRRDLTINQPPDRADMCHKARGVLSVSKTYAFTSDTEKFKVLAWQC